jgi:hypothetical protein
MKLASLVFLSGVVLLSAACSSTTVLLANFNAESLGGPPAATQPTGTLEFKDGAGSVRVVSPPTGDNVGKQWLRVSHPTVGPSAVETVMRARFDTFHGAGKYNLVAAVFIPTGTGAVSLDLETINGSITSSPNFLHLDFMPENNVRLNDNDGDRFGSFPRDTSFVLTILVDSTVAPPTVRISLLGGGGATGQRDLVLPSIAGSFGAVRWWIGFQWKGEFFIDDVLVTKQSS